MTRSTVHDILDEELDRMGYLENIEMEYGSISVALTFVKGQPTMVIAERETRKVPQAA